MQEVVAAAKEKRIVHGQLVFAAAAAAAAECRVLLTVQGAEVSEL